ncbi:DNA alkylation repair protein [filamentous cyanobacterium LEGE 11480]|uniref:DNA alkylation repair protein n=1 Tax=Romeriopsis navalis LEGE 11480 TaxID=2777977 RepID=A0A928Z751_9CYAN|nr:DNA alkylation repair protein [Romeriopsis navalis]MBE9033333.1 DNA alkylation repair protein [Romeriopsis navalis LEGE 11480]
MVKNEGEIYARAIARWQNAENLWQRHASCIPFVSLAKSGDTNFPGFTDLMLEICQTVMQSPERFSQTAAGWLLRELWLAAPERVVASIEAQISQFSSEGLRYATEKMPRTEQLRLRSLRKTTLANFR